jgi:cob(I)alamin adenosyltransferase
MEVWMVLIELIVQTDESALSEIGFMNIATGADSEDAAITKIRNCLASLPGHVVSFEQAHVVEEDKKYGEAEIDRMEKTRNNPNAIILGTFHTYKTN